MGSSEDTPLASIPCSSLVGGNELRALPLSGEGLQVFIHRLKCTELPPLDCSY